MLALTGIQSWSNILLSSFENLWDGFLGFIPSFIGAVIIFAIGWVIAVGVGKLVVHLIRFLKVDQLLDRSGLIKSFEKTGMKFEISTLIGALVKWFVVVVFLLAAADILKLDRLTVFLNDVLLYIPNVIVAILILLAAFLIGNFLHQVVKTTSQAAGIVHANFLSAVTRWSVFIFGLFAALIQLGIAPSLMNTLFTGFVGLIAIAGGLAFGLGGKDIAGEFLGKLKKEISRE